MIWLIVICLVVLIFVIIFYVQKSNKSENKNSKGELDNSNVKTNSFIQKTSNPEVLFHKDIKLFSDIITDSGKKIDLELQNEHYHYISEPKFFQSNFRFIHDFESDIEKIQPDFEIDSKTARLIFDSNHIDGEGPNLITDKSGAIFKFHFGEPTLQKLYDSIWDIFEDVNTLKQIVESSAESVSISKVSYLKDYVNMNEIIRFDIHGFYIENYKEQLESLFKQSDEQLQLNSFTWKDFDWHEVEKIECTLEINNIQKNINIEKSKWYDFRFPEKINEILEEINSPFKISLVHENSWDEVHGVKLSPLEEFKILLKNKLIVG